MKTTVTMLGMDHMSSSATTVRARPRRCWVSRPGNRNGWGWGQCRNRMSMMASARQYAMACGKK